MYTWLEFKKGKSYIHVLDINESDDDDGPSVNGGTILKALIFVGVGGILVKWEQSLLRGLKFVSTAEHSSRACKQRKEERVNWEYVFFFFFYNISTLRGQIDTRHGVLEGCFWYFLVNKGVLWGFPIFVFGVFWFLVVSLPQPSWEGLLKLTEGQRTGFFRRCCWLRDGCLRPCCRVGPEKAKKKLG